MLKTLLVVSVLVSVSFASASTGDKPAAAELAKITARGRMLAEYDVAAWHSTDAVKALPPVPGSVSRYVAQKTDAGWVVAFGRFNESHDRFLIAYEATQGASPVDFSVKKDDPPREDTGFYFLGAKAIDTALQDFRGENRPYNVSFLPADSGQFYVYVEPAQTTNGVYPLGGDVRYLISADGSAIIEKHQMHKSIIENNVPPAGAQNMAGYHTHVLSDLPEDSDVFYVLTRKPAMPEYVYVGAGKRVYTIDVDGSIVILK